MEPCRIIDASMDDFAIARTYPRANPALPFDDDHLPPGEGERSCNGKADDTRADDETFDRFHP
jgi:hypothetical protein